MIFKDSEFEPVEARHMKRYNITAMKTKLVQKLMWQLANYLALDRKHILPEVGGPQREGVEVSYGVMVLNREEYRQVLALLAELAGGDKENTTYKQIRAIMERQAS